MAAWREADHPRDARGRFIRKGQFGAVSITRTLNALSAASDDDLLDVFTRIAQRKRHDRKTNAQLVALDRELARREGSAELEAADASPQARQLDDLVASGESWAEAYAQVYGRSSRKAARDDKYAAVDAARKPGESREQTLRRLYAERTYLQMLAAEQATRGHMLKPACAARGKAVAALFSGPRASARKCATEDLQRFWADQDARQTYAEFKARLVGDRAQVAELVGAGQGRDFGL